MVRSPVFSTGSLGKPTLDIRPTSPFVVFYGSTNEAQDTELSGTLVLTNPDALAARSVKISLIGHRKVSWITNTVTPQPVVSKRTFLKDEVLLYPSDGNKSKGHKIAPGVHEWSFKFSLPRDTPESVEGLLGNHIIYTLEAVVDRGKLAKDLTASKHIRIIRTLGQDHMDAIPVEQINEDIWANKIVYKITVPQRNYIVGTSMTADFVLCPLRKGVTIGTIRMELLEHMVLYSEYSGRMLNHTRDLVVASHEMDIPPDSLRMVPEGEDDADRLFDESYRFQMTLDLPKSLRACRQTVDTEFVQIVHKLRLYVNIHNPEGHTSQLLVKNHVHLFISPRLPPSDDQSVHVDQQVVDSHAGRSGPGMAAPPTYGEHQLDELYREIDTSGFMTPAPRASNPNSGVNTPFYTHSRNASAEHLPASLDAIAQDGACAQQLSTRLHNLSMGESGSQASSSVTQSRRASYHSSGGSTPHNGNTSAHHSDQPSPQIRFSQPVRQNTSPQDYFSQPESSTTGLSLSAYYDMDALSRIPSYNTAVRTPIAPSPIYEGLPSYDIATSRPPSPQLSPMRTGGSGGHSPTHSLDTLREETDRNTELNSRRGSWQRNHVHVAATS